MFSLSKLILALESVSSEDSAIAAPGSNPFNPDDFVNKVFPNNIWELIIQISAFVVLLLIVFFLGYKPVKRMMKKRADFIQNELDEAMEKNKIATEAAMKKDETIAEGKEEASRIIAAAKAQANLEAENIRRNAVEDAAKAKKKADEEIELAKKASIRDTQKEMIDVALAASSAVLGREVNSDDNSRLVSEFIDSINSKEGE